VPGLPPFFRELLEHQGGTAVLEPAPAQLALDDPVPSHLESQAVDIKAQGLFDVGDHEKRHGLLDVCSGFCLGVHGEGAPLALDARGTRWDI